jgi:hypothetical protein
LFAVQCESDCIYGLLKLREQEDDAQGDFLADGDTPGVTVSFISFSTEALIICLEDPTNENRQRLDIEIDRVVARRGERHNECLKAYFVSPAALAPYLIADIYVKYIASLAKDSTINVPEHYKRISKNKSSRLYRFIEFLNQKNGRIICDHEKIYIESIQTLTEDEKDAILATHTGNTSVYSFAAEVEYHAKFLTFLAKIKIPLIKKSFYESAVRADMTIEDADLRVFAPFYKEKSKIVTRHYELHKNPRTEDEK